MEIVLSIIAIAISVISAGFTLYTFFWTARHDCKQNTLDAYNRLQEQALDVLNGIYLPQLKKLRKIKNPKNTKNSVPMSPE